MRATVLAAILILAWPAAARAQPQGGAEVDSYTRARERFAEGRYHEALALFRQVLEATDSPNARLYVARCLAKLGRAVEAYDEMARTVRDASDKAKIEARFAATRDAAIQELEPLQARVGRIIVEVPTPAPELAITFDGEPIAARYLGVAKAVAPGVVVVEVSAPGRGRARQEVSIPAGEAKTVVLELAPPPSEDAPTPLPPDDGVPPLTIGGAVIAGVGAASMVAFAVTASQAKQKHDRLQEACGEGPCTSPGFDELVDDGKTLQTVANVTLAVGAVGLAAGAALIVVGSLTDEPAASEAARRLRLAPLPGGGFASYRIRF